MMTCGWIVALQGSGANACQRQFTFGIGCVLVLYACVGVFVGARVGPFVCMWSKEGKEEEKEKEAEITARAGRTINASIHLMIIDRMVERAPLTFAY